MRITQIFNAKTVILIIILAILLGIIGTVLCSCVERLVYPRQYREAVEMYCEKYAVPSALAFAVIKVESNFKSDAVSSAGAIGLMQLLPSTAQWLASIYFNENPDEVDLYDADTNIRYGVYYLQYLFSRFGSWEKAIIAYNWGEGNFRDFIDSNGYTEGNYSSIPVHETKNYVKKVTHHWQKYKNIYK